MKKILSVIAVLVLFAACEEAEDSGGSSNNIYPSSISLNNNDLTLHRGEDVILQVSFSPSDAIWRKLTWVSLNPEVASVTDGIVVGLKPGKTEILVKCGNAVDKCSVTVTCGEIIDGHECVDMGLGLKWATCNLGADEPQDFGDYYAWADAQTYYTEGHAYDKNCTDWAEYQACWDPSQTLKRSGYNWASYMWMARGQSNAGSITKYTSADGHSDFSSYDFVDDPARVHWRGGWRTPSKEDWNLLIDTNLFSWEWTDDYNGTGVKGMIVTSMIEGAVGNFIFLPAAGYRTGVTLADENAIGDYWSETRNPSQANYAIYLSFNCGNSGFGTMELSNYGVRYLGHSIRPVTEL